MATDDTQDVILIPDHLVVEKPDSRLAIMLKDDYNIKNLRVTVELKEKGTGKIRQFLKAAKHGDDIITVVIPALSVVEELAGEVKLSSNDGFEKHRIPFTIPVLSPLATLFHNSISKGKHGMTVHHKKALLASTMAYLTTLSPQNVAREGKFSEFVLINLMALQSQNDSLKANIPELVKDICASKRTVDETLLHFSLRHNFKALTEKIVNEEFSVNTNELMAYLDEPSYDHLTPLFLASEFYPEILPKLKKHQAERYPQLCDGPHASHPRRRSAAQDARRKVSEMRTRMMNKFRKHSKAKRHSFQVDKSMSMQDIPSQLAALEYSRSMQSFNSDDEDDDDDLYIPMSPAPAQPISQRTRKISRSLDAGLDSLCLRQRPLPDIPDAFTPPTSPEDIYDVVKFPRAVDEDHCGRFSVYMDQYKFENLYDIPRGTPVLVPEERWGSFSVIDSSPPPVHHEEPQKGSPPSVHHEEPQEGSPPSVHHD